MLFLFGFTCALLPCVAPIAFAQRAATVWEKRVLVGTIGDRYDVRVTLRRRDRNLTGSYYHESNRISFRDGAGVLYLAGTVNRDGRFSLVERETADRRGAVSGVLRGRLSELSADGAMRLQLVGTWSRPKTKQSTPFVWTEDKYKLGKGVEIFDEKVEVNGVHASVPQLKGIAQAEGFNSAVKALILARLKTLAGATSSVDYDITHADDRFISIRFTDSADQTAAAPFVEVFNYDQHLGRALELADLFDAQTDYMNLLTAQSARIFQRTKYKSGVDTSVDSPAFKKWNVTAKGLLINFDVPPALGRRVDAFLPCDLLVNIIAADGALGHCRQGGAPK